jgi:hypothetical protein
MHSWFGIQKEEGNADDADFLDLRGPKTIIACNSPELFEEVLSDPRKTAPMRKERTRSSRSPSKLRIQQHAKAARVRAATAELNDGNAIPLAPFQMIGVICE